MGLTLASGTPLWFRLPLSALIASFGTIAGAMQCTFVAECLETEACAETSFSLTLEPGPGASDATMVTDAESIPASIFTIDSEAEFLVGTTGTAIHVLSPLSGEARYSVHLPDVPMMVNYIGTCTEG